MLAWRCTALASELACSTQTTSAMLATRPRRSAHVRSPCRCEFMLLRRAIGCCSTMELAPLDFFLTSPISPSSRMLPSNALALFMLKRMPAGAIRQHLEPLVKCIVDEQASDISRRNAVEVLLNVPGEWLTPLKSKLANAPLPRR